MNKRLSNLSKIVDGTFKIEELIGPLKDDLKKLDSEKIKCF